MAAIANRINFFTGNRFVKNNRKKEDLGDKDKYGAVVYLKTAIWMYVVELSIGQENLDKVIHEYYKDWKFKHPYPEDLKAKFESVLGIKVDELFNLLNKTGKFE